MSDKLHILGANDKAKEEKIPTVLVQAIKVIHPIFQNPETGQMLPPPPDHAFRVGFQLAITTEGRVVQETPGIFFISGDSKDEIADRIKNLVIQGLNEVEEANRTVKQVGPEHLRLLKKFEQEEK